MKKKLLVLLIAVIPTLIPNMASAMAIEIDEEAQAGVLYDYKWCDGCTP
jgi:hypothetical protein